MSDVLKDLQLELVAEFQSIPLFADSEVTVIAELRGDTENEIERELANLGIAVIVSPPSVRPLNPERITTTRCRVVCEVLILEESLNVGEGLEGLQVVAAIIKHMASIKPDRTMQHVWKLGERGFRPGIYASRKSFDENMFFYQGEFEREVKL